MKCANCSNEALYIYGGAGMRDTLYCPACLPTFLKPQAKAGVLRTTDVFDQIRQTIETRMLPEPTAVDEDVATVEEPEPEVGEANATEAEEPTPAPKKRTQKRVKSEVSEG